jgi:adenosylcobinamide-phosphate synthase
MIWTLAWPLALMVAMWIDHRLGEPPAWAHPVVGMGRYLGAFGPALTRLPPVAALLGGAMAWLAGACVLAALALCVELVVTWVVVQGSWPDGVAVLGFAVLMGLMLKPLLAWRMLRDEVAAVERALGQSLPEGRMQLQRLVSRDVDQLDEAAVRESAIESLAENLNDSLVAPLFWLAVGGFGAMAVYRFANTADAMWGYRGRYEWAGKWAAKVDDALSWLPARITALLLCLAAGQWPAWRVMREQARLTPSPNGGWPMGAMALLLGVCLRKPQVYALNAQARHALAADTTRALRLGGRAAWLGAVMCACAMAASSLTMRALS